MGPVHSKKVSSAGQNTVSQSALVSFAFGLPPLAEQRQVVAQVDQLLDLSDVMAQIVGLGRDRIDKLSQSILAKAFRGELVPQDPNDEPASVLLERIRSERQANSPGKNGKKPTSRG